MFLIDNLSDNSNQTTTLQMEDGSVGTLELLFHGATNRWTFNFTHPQFPNGAIKGQMLCVHPNILRNFKNLLSFGMTINSTDGQDPVNIEDFVSGRVQIYIINAADVDSIEATFYEVFT